MLHHIKKSLNIIAKREMNEQLYHLWEFIYVQYLIRRSLSLSIIVKDVGPMRCGRYHHVMTSAASWHIIIIHHHSMLRRLHVVTLANIVLYEVREISEKSEQFRKGPCRNPTVFLQTRIN